MNSIFIFLFFVLFPFGQIFRIGVIQPIDFIAGSAAAYSLFIKHEVPQPFRYLRTFLFFAAISWVFSVFIFPDIAIFYGLLYLLRLAAYFYFGVYIVNFIALKTGNKRFLLDSLLAVSIISSFLGWVQFFTFPDLKPFFVWGWDMHLFRITGTFLDPSFLGLIIVFGLILSIQKFMDNKNTKNGLVIAFLFISLAFTYSRASYLAFVFAVIAIVYFSKKFKKLIFLIFGLGILVFFLPTSKNHSIELFRSFSAIARIENYQTTLSIFSKSPVFGIGYNNMCIAYQKYIGPQDFTSHACSGSDSSILFILTTTGVVGFLALLFGIFRVIANYNSVSRGVILPSSFIALLVHSLFSNSMFYPWIMGWMMILLAISVFEVDKQ